MRGALSITRTIVHHDIEPPAFEYPHAPSARGSASDSIPSALAIPCAGHMDADRIQTGSKPDRSSRVLTRVVGISRLPPPALTRLSSSATTRAESATGNYRLR